MKPPAWIVVLAGAIALVILLERKKMAGRSNGLIAFAQAIAHAEGFGVPGAIPTVRNNPGDLKMPSTFPEITTYPTPEDGWQALYGQLDYINSGRSPYYSASMTIAEMGRVWTATEQNYWTANVVASLRSQGFDVNENSIIGEILT